MSRLAVALAVAGATMTLPLGRAQAVVETNEILVTNQYGGAGCQNEQLLVANAFTGALVADLGTPNTSFGVFNEAKPYDMNRKIVALWGGSSTYGQLAGIGVYDRVAGAWTQSVTLPSSIERGANSPHSVALLPDGYFAVAHVGQVNGIGSGSVLVINPATGAIVDSEGLASAHGVEWDAGRNLVFAVGMDEVRRYTYNQSTHQLAYTNIANDLPGTSPGGHDLRRRRTDDSYFVTTNLQGHVLDPDTGVFTTVTKFGGAAIGGGVKSLDQRFDGVTEYSYLGQNKFNFNDRATTTATFCMSSYKAGRWLYASGEKVYPEDGEAPPPVPAPSGIGYGFPHGSVDEVQAAGADLTYSSSWAVGGDISGVDNAIADAQATGTTPIIHWYYWGSHINRQCVDNWNDAGITSQCGGRNRQNWDAKALELKNLIAGLQGSADTIVILETEFNNYDVKAYEPLDGYLVTQANILKTADIKIALGYGEWADNATYTTYDRAIAAVDYAGTQILWSCIRKTDAEYAGAFERVRTVSADLKARFGKPVFIFDFGLSTYSGASSGDPDYATAPLPKDCKLPAAANYELSQETEYAQVFAEKQALKDNGVIGFVFREYYDEINRPNWRNDYHLIAEKWWGIRRNIDGVDRAKLSYDDVIAGIQAENGSTPTPGPLPGTEWSQEAEAFASRPVGGSGTDAAASGGTFWNIWSNGTISTTLNAPAAGVKHVAVVAKGDPSVGVWPQMQIRVDGTLLADVTVGSTTWSSYAAAVTLTAGSHTLEVSFSNDGLVNGDDRNLLVDVARSEPAAATWTREIEAFTTKTAGGETVSAGASGGKYWNLWSNGYVEHAMTVPYASQHELHVVARGDVAGGVWPIMKVYVDGTLALTQTVSTTTWTAYRIRRAIAGGTRAVRVEFTNDGVVGSEDRNLKLDLATLYS